MEDQPRAQQIASMRKFLEDQGNTEGLERFNEIHPLPPPAPTTLVQALTATVDSARRDSGIPSPGPWYGLRHRFMMTCSAESRFESHMKDLL